MATANPFTAAQAPAAMQMMAPDLAAQQMQLSRQQKIADILREQSLTPLGDTQTLGGWAIQKSPIEGLAKIAQALGANYAQGQTDEKQLALSQALMGRMGDILGGGGTDASTSALAQGATQQPSAPDASGAMVNQGGVGPTLGNAIRMDNAPKPAPNNFTIGNLLKGQVIGDIGGQAAGSAYWDQFKSTEGMKTDRYLGITPDQTRASELAKRLKEGTQSLQPGQTNVFPDGSKFVAPNFETGVAGGFDAQGNPFATAVPGASMIAASRAGQIKQAEAGIADKFAVPVKVDAVNGPVALTPAQQRASANGGVDPAMSGGITNPGNMRPAGASTGFASYATPQDGLAALDKNLQNYGKQGVNTISAIISKWAPPNENNTAAYIADVSKRLGVKSDQSLDMNSPIVRQALSTAITLHEHGPAKVFAQASGGIKLQDDSSRKFGEQVASSSATSLLEGRDKAKAASDSLIGIQKAREAIGGGVFQGSGAETKLAIAKFVNANIPGVTIEAEKVTNTDYLKSTLGAGLLAEAKTLGTNPSNADATRINDIVGSLSKDPNAMKKILDWRQEMAEKSIKNHNSTVSDAENRGMSSPYELRVNSPAPTSAPTTPVPSASAKTFLSLPNPAEFSGKRMRAPDGSVIRSNGKTWTKE